jgi:hypothetical protein
MSRTRRNAALALAVALAITGLLPLGCQKGPGGGANAKKQGGAISEKDMKSAGKTVKGALLKNANKGKPAGGESAPQPDRESPPAVPKIPEMNYAATDTAKLAAIMDDIQLTPEPYYYASVGRRDLFEPLVQPDAKQADDAEPSSRDLRVVGILWGEHDRFALVESSDGRSRILREGDALGDGIVTRVMPDKVVLHVTEYGSSRTVTMPLVQGGGSDESPRSRNR